MLKHLKPETVQTIISQSEAMVAKSSGGIVVAKDIPLEEILAEDEIRKTITALPRDTVIELLALMWAGQHKAPYQDMLAMAKKSKDGNEAHYIAGKAMLLATYLRAGLASLKTD